MIFKDTASDIITLPSRRGKGEVFTKLGRIPGVQMIYASALACTRHRNIDFITLQRQGRLSFLMFDEVDMVTGDYIEKTKQAAAEIGAERNPTGIVLLSGCQNALLSTDYRLLSEEIEEETGIPVRVHDGCRLCGFDEEEGGPSAVDKVLYDFIRPTVKSTVPTVNILSSGPVDENCELLPLLNQAGVQTIRSLHTCRTWADYQSMGSAWVNIITSPKDTELATYLEEKLGIPWVCPGGIYSTEDLAAAYEKLGSILSYTFDLSRQAADLAATLAQTRSMAEGKTITVEDDGELAKWLFTEGFPVTNLKLNPHQGITKEQRHWLDEHGITVEHPMRGGKGAHGHPGGGRPDGRPGGRPNGKPGHGAPEPIQVGYAGAMAALNALKHSAGGDAR